MKLLEDQKKEQPSSSIEVIDSFASSISTDAAPRLNLSSHSVIGNSGGGLGGADDDASSLRSTATSGGADNNSRACANSVLTSDDTILRRGDGAQVEMTRVKQKQMKQQQQLSSQMQLGHMHPYNTSMGIGAMGETDSMDMKVSWCNRFCCCFKRRLLWV
mmetsp:Transcript_12841/g.14494  ORF Transcript_12841/g.14494 Transcript_12841/m.14494 type:complete len:160 (+) Transcript_12841:358-837(+)